MQAERLLLSLCAPPSRVGFHQLVATIEYVMQHPELTNITRDIYPAVARACHTRPSCIDHNLRSIIEDIWRYGDMCKLKALFPNAQTYRPGNKAFVFTVASHLLLSQRERAAAHSAQAPSRNSAPGETDA